jgi:heme-degrading monooxygenase HmoA
MNRRTCFQALAAAPALLGGIAHAEGSKAIQLHVDLEVDPAKEKELAANYTSTFRPAISKQPGFVDVKLLKLAKEEVGKAPPHCTYRLLVSFNTEKQQKAWAASALHAKVWPTIEGTLKGQKYYVMLYDVV